MRDALFLWPLLGTVRLHQESCQDTEQDRAGTPLIPRACGHTHHSIPCTGPPFSAFVNLQLWFL